MDPCAIIPAAQGVIKTGQLLRDMRLLGYDRHIILSCFLYVLIEVKVI